MILLFYCFDYVVGPKEANWWANCWWEEWWRGGAWAQSTNILCKPYLSHAKKSKEAMSQLESRGLIFLMPWDDNISHGLTKPCVQAVNLSGVIPLFTRKQRLEIFPLRLYKENIIFGAGTRRKREKKRRKAKNQRSKDYQGAWGSILQDFSVKSVLFCFLLLFMHFILAMSG